MEFRCKFRRARARLSLVILLAEARQSNLKGYIAKIMELRASRAMQNDDNQVRSQEIGV